MTNIDLIYHKALAFLFGALWDREKDKALLFFVLID